MEPQDLSELIALYAIDALDADEQSYLEEQLAEVEELVELQETVAAIAYSAPLVPMSGNLKERLFQRIEAELSIPELLQQSEQVDWQPYPLTPGVLLGTLSLDPDKREIRCFVRAHGAIRFPFHSHAGNEEIVVLEGNLVIDGKVYVKGDRIYSQSNTAHRPETQSGCLLFLHTSLDDEVLAD